MTAEQTISERVENVLREQVYGLIVLRAKHAPDCLGDCPERGCPIQVQDYGTDADRHDLAEQIAAALAPVVAEAKAEGWDAGYTSGHSNAMRRMSDEPNAPTTPNPHRAEQIGQRG